MEDWRKKSSKDFQLGKRGVKEEDDGDEEKLSDNASCEEEGENRNSLPQHRALSVGFSSLPDQIYRKSLRRGFNFVVLVIGESGLGKSTLINSLFLTDVYSSSGVSNKIEKTTEVREHQVTVLKFFQNRKMKLTIPQCLILHNSQVTHFQ